MNALAGSERATDVVSGLDNATMDLESETIKHLRTLVLRWTLRILRVRIVPQIFLRKILIIQFFSIHPIPHHTELYRFRFRQFPFLAKKK